MRSGLLFMQSKPGTYALVMACSSEQSVEIGKCGRLRTRPGFYVYVGSAFGPGGLRSRITHHMNISRRPHWHIDYLRPLMDIVEIWYTFDIRRREHQWVDVLNSIRRSAIPLSGFGASDCCCKSHLYFFHSRPFAAGFRRQIRASLNFHSRITVKKTT